MSETGAAITDKITNLFVHRSAAKRYAAARPYFHPLVVQKIREFTGISRFSRALDVACGTGQSSRAVAEIADVVHAVDISPDMLAEAERSDSIRYQVATAEQLPFADRTFDLMTVGLAFHWFDQAAFLREASRVLKLRSWLIVYNSGFYGEMAEDTEFKNWACDVYPKRFPTPPRRSFGVTAGMVAPFQFALRKAESFLHDEWMTEDQLTQYLTTQTNVIAAVESGDTPLEEAAAWIAEGISPYFAGAPRKMKFGGMIWYLQRLDDSETRADASIE